ncbi:MAG: TIGR01212 family radical SAM protein [Clostridia bacterium]|nr:TIGR01212 family radical SAM protein [Clostridia bacterium]
MRFLSDYLKETCGEKVYKLSLSSGCTCPNRDGTKGTGGCAFCSEGGSGGFASPLLPLPEQFERAKALIGKKTGARSFIAYFQSFTNTYGDVGRLRPLYEEAIRRPEVRILSLGTRPDCLGPEVMEMLVSLREIKPVWVELGLQTVHDATARAFRRGYDFPIFLEGYRKLKEAGIPVVVHVIFGLPGETRGMMLDTVRTLAALDPPPDGVKLQMLHILRGTSMGDAYEKEPWPMLSLEEYADLVAESLRLLPEETVIHRLTGDGPGKLLLAPEWTRNKKRVLNAIRRKAGPA